jgi:WD40 repeat protein
VQWYDLATRQRIKRMETFGDLTEIAFSPDGSLVASARLFTTDDGIELSEVRVWETATGAVRFVLDRCHGFSFAPQRPEVAVASRSRCVIYDSRTGEKLRECPSLAGAIRLTYATGGTSLCGIVSVEAGFALRNCDAADGRLLSESVPQAEPFYSLTTSRIGSRLATGHAQGIVLVWDLATLRPAARIATGGEGRASPFFAADGSLLAAADQESSDVVIWDWPSGRQIAHYTFRQGAVPRQLVKSPARVVRPEEDPARFAFAPDGATFLGGPFGGIVRLVTDGREIARFGD